MRLAHVDEFYVAKSIRIFHHWKRNCDGISKVAMEKELDGRRIEIIAWLALVALWIMTAFGESLNEMFKF